MNLQSLAQLFQSFFSTIGYLFLFIVFGLFFDSTYMTDVLPHNQHISTFFMLIGFVIVYSRVTSRYKSQMLYAVIIGVIGEYLFSIGLGMYTYRLGNIPHYVPPGHALVLVATIYFCKESIVKKYRKLLEKVFTVFILVYATLFLIFAGDVFGFIMSLLVVFLLRNKPRERLFYLSMYIVVAFLEIIGTNYGCWFWPETAYDTFSFLKSANPPSGISLFYFLLDLGSLWVYKQRHKIAWNRMKNIRKIRAKVAS
ncbi:MAG: hypothetical protein HWD85_07270 [Flavobacteriaceae bacterium]|nr:hypothetical protein [Flavobacteriaceae bacterium]